LRIFSRNIVFVFLNFAGPDKIPDRIESNYGHPVAGGNVKRWIFPIYLPVYIKLQELYPKFVDS